MIAKQSSAVERCVDYLEDLHKRIASRFARSEVRDRANRYLSGLLDEVNRKNGFYEKAIIVKSRRGGCDRPLEAATTAPLRLLLSAVNTL